jgi:hypothetical protein
LMRSNSGASILPAANKSDFAGITKSGSRTLPKVNPSTDHFYTFHGR